MPKPARRRPPDDSDLADRLHTAAVRLLRRLRAEDRATRLSGPRASALSVVVFGGPIPLGELAAAEQVRPPTMTKLVEAMRREGLVEKTPDPGDRRIVCVAATPRGRRVLETGRARRIARLVRDLRAFAPSERRLLARALPVFERLAVRRAPGTRRSRASG